MYAISQYPSAIFICDLASISLTLSTKADKTDRSVRIFLNRSRMEERLSADKSASAENLA